MTYSSSRQIHGHTLSFGKIQGRLIIRTSANDQDFEILPSAIWGFDLPEILVSDSHQWLNLRSGHIEFRPLEKTWYTNIKNNILEFNETQPQLSWMHQGNTIGASVLLDVDSKHQEYYGEALKFFEELRYVHMTLGQHDELEIHLLRFGFTFSRHENGDLYSREFSGFKISDNQGIGTLHGLQSRLVLEGVNPEAGRLERICLIPFGEATITPRHGHVNVHLQIGGDRRRSYHKYKISEELNCLQSDGDLLSQLYLTYLHAVTSFAGEPDELTMLTGMEMSLHLLRQGSMNLTGPIQREARTVLSWVARLSPIYAFCLPQMKSMETVKWNNALPTYTQYWGYQLLVNKILAYNERSSFLFPQTDERQSIKCKYAADMDLLERAGCLTRYAYPVYAFDPSHPHSTGTKYQSREAAAGESQDAARSVIALIKLWPANLDVDPELWRKFLAMGTVSGFGEIHDTPTLTSLLDLNISGSWGALLRRCVGARKAPDEFMLSF